MRSSLMAIANFGDMEPTKFTVRLTAKAKRNLKRRSVRNKQSMNAVLNELLMELENDPVPEEVDKTPVLASSAQKREAEAQAWIKRNLGLLADKVKPEDWNRKDRVGDILRKYAKR
ncbi:MAG TPA: hypothetical protein PLV70_02635 [Flavobacteriales bacterium]|nr:hypothetical protein [Flavobacteriales bacterium]HRO38832.1 hypothetical protein [Flavobacteriales bacterium]HRP81654.1 hypothetical protein [Flavobacteriales bacterium]HRQ83992.1 hypothetical protein [Flavobacteriales bacterium]